MPRRILRDAACINRLTGQDLALTFGGHVGLVDALLMKIGAAESRGEYLIACCSSKPPAGELLARNGESTTLPRWREVVRNWSLGWCLRWA